MDENTPSRRDDIVAIIYSLVYLFTGYKQITKQRDIGTFIKEANPDQFCLGAEALTPILKEAYSYKYS
jgi:hypothetical protein